MSPIRWACVLAVAASSLAIGWAVSAWLDAALASITIGSPR